MKVWYKNIMNSNDNINLKIQSLISYLNIARNNYYNHSKSELTDYEYDKLYDELVELENKYNIIYSNSPTQSVGYEVNTKLPKVEHEYPMLSLDKTKQPIELINFSKDKEGILMYKADGLTICNTYEHGQLVSSETRGNGYVGSLITDNAKTFINLPLTIPYKDKLIVYGEAIILKNDFDNINKTLSDDNKFKTQRNLASGSVNQLDPNICKQRNIHFIAWRLVYGSKSNKFSNRLNELKEYGFETIPYIKFNKNIDILNKDIDKLKDLSIKQGFPIDGLVFAFEDIKYGQSLGSTAHHRKDELAFKYNEDSEDTKLKYIEWSVGKTGVITPILVFDKIELMDTTVERASAHNLSILKSLNIKNDSILTIVKKNDIIPQCICASGGTSEIDIPKICPVCGSNTEINDNDGVKTLYCTNYYCKGRLLGLMKAFVSKNGMNIDGLSEQTLKKFIDLGWITNYQDIYNLKNHYNEIKSMEGFGLKSANNLINAIENSRNTTLSQLLVALNIPLLGKQQAKELSNYCNNDIVVFNEYLNMDNNGFKNISCIGEVLSNNMNNWFKHNLELYYNLLKELEFSTSLSITNETINSELFSKKLFCITGKLHHFSNRDELVSDIEKHGGKFIRSVTKKTNYLINNDTSSNSSKNKKAKELNIPIISEEEYINMIKM